MTKSKIVNIEITQPNNLHRKKHKKLCIGEKNVQGGEKNVQGQRQKKKKTASHNFFVFLN